MERTVLKGHWRRWVLKEHSARWVQTAPTERLAHWVQIRQKAHSGNWVRTGLKVHSVPTASGALHWLQLVPLVCEALRFGRVEGPERVFGRKFRVRAREGRRSLRSNSRRGKLELAFS